MFVLYDMTDILQMGIDVHIGRSLIRHNKICIFPISSIETYTEVFNNFITKFPEVEIKSTPHMLYNNCFFTIQRDSPFDHITKGLELVYYVNRKKIENYHVTMTVNQYNFLSTKAINYIKYMCINGVIGNKDYYIKTGIENDVVDVWFKKYE